MSVERTIFSTLQEDGEVNSGWLRRPAGSEPRQWRDVKRRQNDDNKEEWGGNYKVDNAKQAINLIGKNTQNNHLTW